MEVKLTSEQENYLLRLAARVGRSPDEAMQEAVSEWIDRQTALMEFKASLDAAEASITRGEGIEITPDSMRSLADDVKRRGRERATAKRAATS